MAESLWQFLRPKVGRGFAPPSTARRDLWVEWAFVQFEIHPKWWRFGVSFRWPFMLALLMGPFAVGIGKPVSVAAPYSPVWTTRTEGSSGSWTVTLNTAPTIRPVNE